MSFKKTKKQVDCIVASNLTFIVKYSSRAKKYTRTPS